jgi:hypothetical protein
VFDLADNDRVKVLRTNFREAEEMDRSKVIAIAQVLVSLREKTPEPLVDVFCQERCERRL